MLKYEKKIREIISSHTNANVDSFESDGDLRDIGIGSLSFIAIIVDIENEFGIEFPNDMLVMKSSGTIALLNQIVEDAGIC